MIQNCQWAWSGIKRKNKKYTTTIEEKKAMSKEVAFFFIYKIGFFKIKKITPQIKHQV